MAERLSLSIDDAAEAIGLSRKALVRLLDSGVLPSFHLGRRRLVPARALDTRLQEIMTDEQAATAQRLRGRRRKAAL